MRFPFCLLLLAFSFSVLPGQVRKIDVAMDAYLNSALKAEAAIAKDSVMFYRTRIAALAKEGRTLMGNDKVSTEAFGHGGLLGYEQLYGRDTGRMVWTVVEQWQTMLNRHQGWQNYAARVLELRSKNGHRELEQRYGDRLLGFLENKKKLEQLIKKEILRGVLFFNKWNDGVNKYARWPSLYKGKIVSIKEIAKDIRDFNLRRGAPDPVNSVTAGGTLAPEDILFSYPQNQQANFYRMENSRETGTVALRRYVGYELIDASNKGKLWARWKSSKGEVLYTRAVAANSRIDFRVPAYFLRGREIYQLAIVQADTDLYDDVLGFYLKRGIDQVIQRGVFHRDVKNVAPQETLFTAYFRVSSYGSFYGKTLGQSFTKVAGSGTSYSFAVDEAFGPEEITGLHGAPPLASFSAYNCPAVEDLIKKIYSSATQAFLSHPSQEYVAYLERNRDSLNIDSLVAIEFLPFKERYKKYRWLRYQDDAGKRVTPFSKKPPLPAKPTQPTHQFLEGATQPITEAVFRDPSLYGLTDGKVMVRDTFAEAVRGIALRIAPDLEQRAEDYADILRQLNELSPQEIGGKSFAEIVRDINLWNVIDPRNEKLVGDKTCFPKKVPVGYNYPLGVIMLTSSSMDVVAPEE